MKKKKRIYLQKLADTYRDGKTVPPCAHFGHCGGCMFQDISYENQLLLKRDLINDTLQGIVEIDKVHGSTPLGYRNRMDMVTAFDKFGLRKAGSYKVVVDVESCQIMQEKMNSSLEKIRPLIKDIEDYNYLSHSGYLRYVVFRQARFSDQLMVNFVIAEKENRLNELIETIDDDADSISLILQDGLADLSFGEIFEDIKAGFIEESFDDIKYRITPNSFFQSNSTTALEIYKRVRDETEGQVLDLYSGVGTISLFIAKKADAVVGVELVQEAVDAADLNKELNDIHNAHFICVDAKDYMREHASDFDTVIVDPPRSGLHPKMLKHINEMKADKIIYVSCNPGAFRNEVDALTNFTLQSFEAYDMFPQTPHLEALAVLKRK